MTPTPKLKNMKLVYNLIRKFGPVTKSNIIKKTGLKQTTCTRLIDDLLKEELIKESGFAASSGGRKPIMYDINEKLFYSIGIDLSRTFTKVILLDVRLNPLAAESLPITENTTPGDAIQFMHHAINQMLAEQKVTKNQLVGIGVGSVEPLDREKGIMTDPLHFPNEKWKNVPIVDALKEKWDTIVLLDSGINAAVLAEYQIGLSGSVGNMTYMIAGMGIRTGVIVNHHLLKVRPPYFSRFGDGHMVIHPEGRRCICGNNGCLHTYSTIPALKTEVMQKRNGVKDQGSQDRKSEQITLEWIQSSLATGDRVVIEVIEELGYYTGIGIANMMTVLFSDYVVLGGPMFHKLDQFYNIVVKTATERLNGLYPGYDIRFRKGKLGENATAIGAGSMVFDHYLN
jgi:predicted NBD/HSP70 family sugar kinase